MSERGWLRTAVALFFFSLWLAPVQAQDAKPATPAPASQAATSVGEKPILRIGTNLVAGLYYPVGGALCRAIAKAGTVRCLVESTNGSTANIRGLLAGDLEFGIVQSDWQYHAINGSAAFRDSGPVKSLRSVMALQAEPLTLIVRADSGIDSFDKIKGKRIAAGPADSGQHILFDVLLAAWSWRPQDAGTVLSMSSDEAVQGFCAGEVDAVFLMGNHPNALAQRLLGSCNGKMVPVAGPSIVKIINERRYYAPATIAAGIYGPAQPEITTLGVRATLVTTDKVPADLVYALVRSVAENFAEFTAQHSGLSSLKREELAQYGLTAPLHDGALRYYREVGLVK